MLVPKVSRQLLLLVFFIFCVLCGHQCKCRENHTLESEAQKTTTTSTTERPTDDEEQLASNDTVGDVSGDSRGVGGTTVSDGPPRHLAVLWSLKRRCNDGAMVGVGLRLPVYHYLIHTDSSHVLHQHWHVHKIDNFYDRVKPTIELPIEYPAPASLNFSRGPDPINKHCRTKQFSRIMDVKRNIAGSSFDMVRLRYSTIFRATNTAELEWDADYKPAEFETNEQASYHDCFVGVYAAQAGKSSEFDKTKGDKEDLHEWVKIKVDIVECMHGNYQEKFRKTCQATEGIGPSYCKFKVTNQAGLVCPHNDRGSPVYCSGDKLAFLVTESPHQASKCDYQFYAVNIAPLVPFIKNTNYSANVVIEKPFEVPSPIGNLMDRK